MCFDRLGILYEGRQRMACYCCGKGIKPSRPGLEVLHFSLFLETGPCVIGADRPPGGGACIWMGGGTGNVFWRHGCIGLAGSLFCWEFWMN